MTRATGKARTLHVSAFVPTVSRANTLRHDVLISAKALINDRPHRAAAIEMREGLGLWLRRQVGVGERRSTLIRRARRLERLVRASGERKRDQDDREECGCIHGCAPFGGVKVMARDAALAASSCPIGGAGGRCRVYWPIAKIAAAMTMMTTTLRVDTTCSPSIAV